MAEKWGAIDLASCEFEFAAPESGKSYLDDELINRLLGRAAYLKGEITRSLARATKAGLDIGAMKAKGMTRNNLLLKGMVNTGAGHVESADSGFRGVCISIDQNACRSLSEGSYSQSGMQPND